MLLYADTSLLPILLLSQSLDCKQNKQQYRYTLTRVNYIGPNETFKNRLPYIGLPAITVKRKKLFIVLSMSAVQQCYLRDILQVCV